ncbi:protein TolR [Vreelandella arcis]|uniref:Tol-Pal system protein TolR n=1 Tax=Vreelandella arcis TaxID=416873 RepID=A0A1G9YLV4_9GAMM|nr:protein TolR [Halomonas arcis]SDN10100.1 Cell division and transport-associated protein TolR (TC 2.C.1.2.1) [Halomonas arcis]
MQGPFKRGGQQKPMGEINVVPFIDVMLVLLVIFMITAPMLNQGVDVELPQVNSEPIESQDDSDPIIISIDREGAYHISLGDEATQVSLDEITSRVNAILGQRPDTPVMVRGDQSVAYGEVVVLMSTLQRSGVANVGLISEPPRNE